MNTADDESTRRQVYMTQECVRGVRWIYEYVCVSCAVVVSDQDQWRASEGVQQFVSSFRESLEPVPESTNRYGETVAGER